MGMVVQTYKLLCSVPPEGLQASVAWQKGCSQTTGSRQGTKSVMHRPPEGNMHSFVGCVSEHDSRENDSRTMVS